ncbi:tetratricopeptide repeat protein (plasmid) [Streptomyces sp. NBC_00257]|uniref:tetratricopeptide repeat protein n=1 Tax=unclassified Streptomyces TaxID=2593676 RepID=UPI0022500A71|nr:MULTISPECIES: tetratricopeptide repeat protein [unclassified Streptomyces]MCX5434745.1 tetratricopeptide repeat protein [Streptomyces sp. NBC_00062]
MTNYASAAVPQWAAHAWVIWPVFGALALTSVSLLLWERRLSVSETLSARLTPVGHLAGALHGSLRPLHVEQVRGRERELAVLTRLLRRPTGQFAVLCAAGGMGKTTVAAQFAAQAEVKGWSVFWVRWENTAGLAERMTQVAVACGLPEQELEQVRAGQGNLPDVIWNHLARVRRWLIVLDNADEPREIGPVGETVAGYRGWIRPTGGGLLLVTSRDSEQQTWGPCASLLQLESLDAAAGGQVMLDLAPQAGTVHEARELAVRLGGLPLALHAAGTYLARPGSRYRTFTTYRQALEVELPNLLGVEHPDAADSQIARTVVRHTWEVSLDQLAAEGNPLARPLLRLLALLGPAPVPLSLISSELLTAATGDESTVVGLEAALAGLHRYGLLGFPTRARERDGADPHIAQVVLHPLVREINALALTEEVPDLTPWQNALKGRLTEAVSEVQQLGRPGWSTASLLAPHLPFVLDHSHPQSFTQACDTLNALARVLSAARASTQERMLRQHVLDAETRALGPQHPDTLESRNNLALTLYWVGEYAEAVDLHRQTLNDRIRVLGPQHPDTLESRNNLALAMHGVGEYAEAVDLHRQTLNDRIRVLGPQHPDTLESRNRLANALHAVGEYAMAVDLHRQTLRDRVRILGSDHPHTLGSRNNLAGVLDAMGEYAEAIELNRQTLSDRIRVLGLDHPHTFQSRSNLASALNRMGAHAEAVDLHRQTLRDRVRVLGLDHPHTLLSRSNLASALGKMGAHAEAVDLHRQTLNDRIRVLGLDHPHTVNSRDELDAALAASRTGERRRLRWPRRERRNPTTS